MEIRRINTALITMDTVPSRRQCKSVTGIYAYMHTAWGKA